ncbi:MAG: amidohydrolase [Candidatus Hydrogenedentes bacterium]|nr:amidohydrolase [Candidatus Hydrogenedentota bacterium]
MPMIAQNALQSTLRHILPDLIILRHELHQHPEIRFQEHWTSDRIARFLDTTGVPYTRGHAGGTGLIATIDGEADGKGDTTVVLRADIDALEIQEATGLPYASQVPGRMHACGHDGHIACLCGVVKVLAENKHHLRGRVKCIFQPAEEQAAGGKLIVDEGHLDNVAAAFALHAWPQLPLGSVGVGPGPVMAGADFFRIEVQGKGGHGADPAATIDPIVVAAHIITALQSIVSRETNPGDAAVVTVASLHAGTASNIIPETALLEGTFRTLSIPERDRVLAAITRIAQHTATAHRATVHVFGGVCGYPPTINDPNAAQFAQDTVQACFGPDALIPITRPYMTAEDFAFYLQKVPGAFLFLGNTPPDQLASAPGLHTPRFNFNDAALPIGITLLADLALRYLAQES